MVLLGEGKREVSCRFPRKCQKSKIWPASICFLGLLGKQHPPRHLISGFFFTVNIEISVGRHPEILRVAHPTNPLEQLASLSTQAGQFIPQWRPKDIYMAESLWKILGLLSSFTGKNQEVAFRDTFTWKITTLVQVKAYTFNICLLKATHNIK